MKLVLLGTGTPNAESDRSGPCAAVVNGEMAFMVDCGPGAVRRASAACVRGIAQLGPERLNVVFLTHLHSDHTLGLPDVILTPWVLERREPLKVFGPPGTRRMVQCILEAFSEDIRERRLGLQPSDDSGLAVEVTELDRDTSICLNGIDVDAFTVNHGSMTCFGYRFSAGGRTIAISGDTAPFKGMEEAYSGCDVLLHEVYSTSWLRSRPMDWRRYHSSVHTSSEELAAIAGSVGPGHLVLYHQLHQGVGEEELLDEIRRNYSGRVSYGRDLEIY